MDLRNLSSSFSGNNFHLQPASHEVVLKLIEEINPAKAAVIDKIGGRSLKDVTNYPNFQINVKLHY